LQWLAVYFVVMFSDWLQGPYVYALYSSYGFSKKDIAILFIVGFGSSSVVGTFVGALADKYGRKRLCVYFGVLYGIACVTKLSTDFWVLLVGRLLSGVATSLLFSVFEAWMVYEHNQRGFASPLLSKTFSLAVFGNGIAAILAGVVASFVVVRWGFVAPFMVSLVFLVASSIYVSYAWGENYGNSEMQLTKVFSGALDALKDRRILLLGTIQSLFEASMYIFVFLWTPMLEEAFSEMKVYEKLGLHGLIFATFMVCIMVGSSVFRLLDGKLTVETIYTYTLALSGALFLSIALLNQQYITFFGFLIFEMCCGIHFVCIGTLRSRYIPEESRSGVMNLFRVPLNILVVAILNYINNFSHSTIFLTCGVWLLISTWCLVLMARIPARVTVVADGDSAPSTH